MTGIKANDSEKKEGVTTPSTSCMILVAENDFFFSLMQIRYRRFWCLWLNYLSSQVLPYVLFLLLFIQKPLFGIMGFDAQIR